MRSRLLITGMVTGAVLASVWIPGTALGVPGFSRAQGVSCTMCHTVWPQLNADGRLFKESGYQLESLTSIEDDLSLSSPFPISGRINMRLIDKKHGEALTDAKKKIRMRALHEVEAFFAGNAGEKWSFFTELEAEDEWPDPAGNAPGFQVQVAKAAVQYKPVQDVDLTFATGYASPFYADPYNAVNHDKPVRHKWAPSNRGFTPGSSQFVSVSGRPHEQIFLLGAWHANAGRLEGDDPIDFSFRGVVDLLTGGAGTPEISVGGYGTLQQTFDEVTGESSSDNKVNRFGGDVQIAYESLNLHALFGIKDVDLLGEANDTTENVFAVEGNYLVQAGTTWVGPVASVSRYTTNDGDTSWVEGGFFLDCQFTANARCQLGWEGDLSVPDGMFKDGRMTAVFDLGL